MNRILGQTSDDRGVSPVIATIITVAICVVTAAIAYVWIASFTDNIGDTVVEPISISPDLNIERVQDELSLKIIVGEQINWDNYRVTVNNTEVKTDPGRETGIGETIYFDYFGGGLLANKYYELQVVDLKAQTVVYSKTIPARSYRPAGTGVYGYVRSAVSNDPIYMAFVSIHISGQLYTVTTTDNTGAYCIDVPEGNYQIVIEVNSSLPETSGMEFDVHIGNLTVLRSPMSRYDMALTGAVPKNSQLNGYVYDQSTGTPLSGIRLKFTDDLFFNKKKKTNTAGYYTFSLKAMDLTIVCEVNGYKRFTYNVSIADAETKTVDIYLEPIPVHNSVVYGYVYDNSTGSPLIGKKIYAQNNYETNRTKTNVQGYFTFDVVPGNVTIYIDLNNYEYYEVELTLAQDETYRLDIYLDKV